MAQNRVEKRIGMSVRQQQFETELSVYERNKSGWLNEHPDSFVVISEQEVAGFFQSYSEAYEAALDRFGVDRLFLIKQVLPQDRVFVVY
jgi:hypothetical protein